MSFGIFLWNLVIDWLFSWIVFFVGVKEFCSNFNRVDFLVLFLLRIVIFFFCLIWNERLWMIEFFLLL